MNSWGENRACQGRFVGLIRGVDEGVPFASRIGLTDAPVVKIARRIGEGVPFASRIGLTDAPVVKIARRIGVGVPLGDEGKLQNRHLLLLRRP